jgi:hypothetical protein
MTAQQPLDTIVIGAGVAGMSAAALLARDHGQRVLVLERAPWVGGRTLTFVGKGDKVWADGIEMGAAQFRKALAHSSCYLSKCTPGIEQIFERGLLDGMTFENGGHGLFWGNQGRIDHLMRHLGTSFRLPLNKGFAFVRWNGEGRPGDFFQVERGGEFPWMSPEGAAATRAILRDMAMATFEDIAAQMRVSLQTWLEQRNLHPEAYAFLKVLAASQTCQAEPAMTPAGDFIGYMAVAPQIGMNLVKGSVATPTHGGTMAIVQGFEQVVRAHGGEVQRSSAVRDVIIENGRVCGVHVDSAEGRAARTLRAERVICTVPPRQVFSVLPTEPFPSQWVHTLRTRYWGAGLLTGWAVHRRNMLADVGIEPGSFVYMPAITRPEEGFIGAVDMVMCTISAWGDGNAGRGADGKHEYIFSTALTETEMRNPERVQRVIHLCETWAEATYPHWKDSLEMIIWTPGPGCYGDWRPVGTDRPDVKSPWAEGLYFAGDQYGARLWGGGVDAAALSAVMCVDAITGASLESRIFPEFHRGLPAHALATA